MSTTPKTRGFASCWITTAPTSPRRRWLGWRSTPGRFEYVHTPKHGSWLNLVESVSSKMARSFLRHIRVASLDELKQRILKGIDEMNAHPVRFQWKYFDYPMV